MDDATLLTNLSNTLSPNNNIRKPAESLLLNQSVEILPRILSILLSQDNDIPLEIKLVCLTLIKNRIASDWNSSTTSDKIKTTVKNQIVEFIVKLPHPFAGPNHAIVKLSLRIITHILLYGDKDSFQFDLLNFANELIKKDDRSIDNFYIGVLLVLQVAKYNRNLDNNELLDNISMNFCPVYFEFLQSYGKEFQSGLSSASSEKKMISHYILKTLNYITTKRITVYFQNLNENTLQTFCALLCELFYIFNDNIEDFKSSKWILRFFIKLQIKSSLNPNDNTGYNENFLKLFKSSILPHNISSLIGYFSNNANTLSKLVDIKDDPEKERTLYYFLTYLSRCLSQSTYEYLEPHLNMIISNIIVHTLSITTEETELFEDDPIEFINTNFSSPHGSLTATNQAYQLFDISSSDIKRASYSFVTKLINVKPDVVSPLISLSSNILSSNNKFSISCALNILDLVQSHIDNDTMSNAINTIVEINKHLSQEDLWLRCLIYEFFSKIKSASSIDLVQSHLMISLDTSLPLPLILSSLKLMVLKFSAENIDPVQIMQLLLTISDNENLELTNELIDVLVDKYPQQLVPYSSQLINSLCSSFSRIQEYSNNEDKETKQLALLENMLTVIMSVSDKSTALEMNNQLISVISSILDNGLLDLVESTLEIVEELTSTSEQVLNLETVINSFKNYGYEFFDYYTSYFELVYCYGNLQERCVLTELLKWIVNENPLGFDPDDTEFVEFLSNLVSNMVVSCRENEHDNGLSDDVYRGTLEMMFNSCKDKEEFWNNKVTFRCIIGGLYTKPMIVMDMFGSMIQEILLRFDAMVNNGQWSTVYDIKLGLLGLLQIVKGSGGNKELKGLAMDLMSNLCNKLNGAIEHRSKLLKLATGEETVEFFNKENDDDEVEFDEEFDEINKVSILDKIDVLSEIKAHV